MKTSEAKKFHKKMHKLDQKELGILRELRRSVADALFEQRRGHNRWQQVQKLIDKYEDDFGDN